MAQIQPSKILKLSSEIIVEIFKNFSTPVAVFHPRHKSFPWFLGQICAQWRRVFLSMSTHFWGNIEIHVCDATKRFPQSGAYYERALDMLNFYLKCSEGRPLSFSFAMDVHYSEEYVYVIDILDALLAQSMRWVKAELSVQGAEARRLHCIKGRTPLLKSLIFNQMEQSQPDWEDFSMPIDPGFARFVDAFEDSPSLTHLELYMSTNIERWKCDWSSIVVLRLTLENTDNLVVALSQSMRLEELEVTEWPYMNSYVDSTSDSAPINTARSMITLSSLKKMTLSWNAFNVMGALTAPGLEHLSIKFGMDRNAGIIPAFLRRSSCPLGHLVLDSASPAAVVEIVSAVPGLPSLEIHQDYNVDKIINVFNCNLPEGVLLIGPRLKSFQVYLKRELEQEAVVALSNMAASRARNVEVDGLQVLMLWAKYSREQIDFAILQSQFDEQHVELTVDGRLIRGIFRCI